MFLKKFCHLVKVLLCHQIINYQSKLQKYTLVLILMICLFALKQSYVVLFVSEYLGFGDPPSLIFQ